MHIIPIIISFDMTATELLYDEKFDIYLMFSLQKYNNKFESATKKSSFIKIRHIYGVALIYNKR